MAAAGGADFRERGGGEGDGGDDGEVGGGVETPFEFTPMGGGEAQRVWVCSDWKDRYEVSVDTETLAVDDSGRRAWSLTREFARVLCQSKLLGMRNIVVLGCGIGLEGLAVAKAHPQSFVVMTDGNAEFEPCVRRSIARNGLEENCLFRRFRWGDAEDEESLSALRTPSGLPFVCDVVVASEVLYSQKQVEPLHKAVSYLLRKRGGVFLLAEVVRDFATHDAFSRAATASGWGEIELGRNPLEDKETAESSSHAEVAARSLRIWRLQPQQ